VGNAVDFLEHLAEAIEGESLLPSDGPIVVGVSGGADSVALLHGLQELNRTRNFPWKIHVGHLHHGIRGPAADEDARFVKGLAADLDLPVTVEQVDVPSMAKVRQQSIEEAARQARYAFLERICLHTESRHIVLAHHADDNAETVLHRILRGTGLRGLAGIAPVRALSPGSEIVVVRPLLKLHRDQIIAFLRERGLRWREDHSNAETSVTRNRIRLEVLPMLETKINKRVRGALIRLAEQARATDGYLAETAQRTLETLTISRTDRELTLNLPALLKRSRVIRAELVRQAFLCLRVGEQQIDRRHVSAVLRLAEQGRTNKRINLPGRLTVARRYDRLVFCLPDTSAPSVEFTEVAVKVPGRTTLRRKGYWLQTEVLAFDPQMLQQVKDKNDPWTEYVDFDQVSCPLVVRPRKPGDRFCPLGGPGSKKLSDFFSERKVDVADREGIAVVCDQLGPIWVMGMRIDERVKLRRHTTRVLQLTARPLEATADNVTM
jgi:tRNA(Ile)-lysidine synthase